MKYRWISLIALVVCLGSLRVQAMGEDRHLALIHATEINQQTSHAQDLIIAQLDTGVDFNHPNLKGIFLSGYNLVDPNKLPWDDNGHGTETAGIMAAKGDKSQGVQGVLQKVKILPIKVLDQNGIGDPVKVAEGIRLAVDHGARIVLMSLEDPIYSKTLEQAVQYAEDKGVLLVASVGNDKNSVTYPAAFPTVLGVGAVDPQGRAAAYSNHGAGVDVVAPGDHIVTTERQGSTTTVSGTSMAAPQIAAAAALIWEKNPKLSPLEVRMILERSANSREKLGWNEQTGYGLINIYQALQDVADPIANWDEPNNTWEQAKPFSSVTMVERSVSASDPVDWFRITTPYPGKLSFSLSLKQGMKGDVTLELYDEHQRKLTAGTDFIQSLVPKETVYLKVAGRKGLGHIVYQLQTTFSIKADSYESNDTKQTATLVKIKPDTTIIGNFDKTNDEDWFVFNSRKSGKLEIEAIPDNNRMDPVLGIEQEGKRPDIADNGAAGQKETWSSQITPGKYYISLKDYYGNAVDGEYKMNIHFVPGEN